MDLAVVLKVAHAVLGVRIIAALVGREVGAIVMVFVLIITKPF